MAELYAGAVILLHASTLPGHVRFIAHAVREIRNRLPEAILEIKTGGPVQYVNRLDSLADRWREVGPRLDGTPGGSGEETAGTTTEIPVDRGLLREISGLIRDHAQSRVTRRDSTQLLFDHLAPENRMLGGTSTPVVKAWMEATEWFMKNAHDSGRLDTDVDADVLRRQFELFETTLAALVGSFYKSVDGLDEILEDTNT